MQNKFFIRRFRNYFLLLIIPTFIVFLISFLVVNSQMEKELDSRAEYTLSNVNTNLDLVVSNVIIQNDQLTNNSYMVLALKKLFQSDRDIQYSDAIYLRNIKTMMRSIIQSYSYIQSVNLYLDGYNKYFSAENGVVEIVSDEDIEFWTNYSKMDKDISSMIESRYIKINGKEKEVLTFYQRLLLLDGVVIMNIDSDKYRELLDSILPNGGETVLLFDKSWEHLFSWNNNESFKVGDLSIEHIKSNSNQGKWIKLLGTPYLLHKRFNENYGIYIVSLISSEVRKTSMLYMLRMFSIIFLINSAAMLLLAYFTTKRTFKQLYYMIQVFYDAESGIYPTQPKQEMKDEYDVIMNNIIYLFLQTIKLNEELTQKQHDQEVAELKALQLQINPHFLFNTLQNVQLEVRKLYGNTDYVNKILDNLSDILKYALASPMETISLKEEVEYLKKYITIQHFRFGERFIIYYEVEEELMQMHVFRLMLQPLVENSILHGIRHKDGRGYIKLQIFERGGKVHFRVVDNGIGMTKEACIKLKESIECVNVHHIGLANVNSRLKLYYGDRAGIHIRSKAGVGCVMQFVIPKKEDRRN